MTSLVQIIQQTTRCGECHLQPGDRCDICGARQPDDLAQAVQRTDADNYTTTLTVVEER